MRAFLLGVALASSLSLFSGCSKSEGAGPAAVAGATAGKVVELSGAVTATRDGKARDLKQGDAVSSDDVIETGADAKVSIELAHNNARWNLGGGKKTKVSESSAWSLAKADKPAEGVGGDTSAAGRHAERNSAETAATAATASASVDMPAPTADPAVAAVAPIAPGSAPMTTSRPAPGSPAPKAEPKTAPTRNRTVDAPKTTAHRSPGASVGNNNVNTAPPPDLQPETKEVAPSPSPPPPPPPRTEATRAPEAPQISPADVIANDATLKLCLAAGAASDIAVSCKDGACTLTSATNVDATAKKCIVDRLRALKPAGTFSTKLRLAR